MATSAKMSFNYYQNGKYGTLPNNASKDMEISQDMHLKMSKKIAQLTKVIYALNTKNDEHEAILQNVKDQHEEEMQQLLLETKEKISVYKEKIDAQVDFKSKIESLEKCVSEHEQHRRQAIQQFHDFRNQAESREVKLKTENSQRFLELSQDVLQTKKDFEEKLKSFEKWQAEVNGEKERALEELRQAHVKEMENLRNFQRNQDSDWLNQCAQIENKYKGEIESLKEKCDSLNLEKQKLEEDYELKLSKAQAFYEKELEAVKNLNNLSQDEANRLLQEERDKLRKDYAAQESELKKQIGSLVNQLSESEENMEKYKSELEQLQASLQDKDSTSSELSRQLHEAKQDAHSAMTKLKELESELIASKERCSEQAKDLLKNSTLIGQLEATNLQNQSTIRDLKSEITKLKDKLAWLESERSNLQNQQSSMSEQQKSQLLALEKSLEDLSIEKQTLKERYERELESMKNRAMEKEKEFNSMHEMEMKKLKKLHEEDLDRERSKAEKTLADTKEELLAKYREDTEKLRKERDDLQAEFDGMRAHLTSRLEETEAHVQRLDKIVKESEQGLGSASGHINNLKEQTNRLQSELENTRAQLKAEKTTAANLKAELEKLKLLHDSKMKEASHELKTKLEKLSKDLENKWSDTLRTECLKLRADLNEQKELEKKAALQQLALMKDEEIAANRKGWEARVEDLNKQIASLKDTISNSKSLAGEEMDKLRQAAEEEKRRLEKELVSVAEEYALKIETMESSHKEKMRKYTEHKEQELEELEKNLKNKHIEDMQAQMSAHKVTVESLKEQAENTRLRDLEEQSKRHETQMDEMKTNMSDRHAKEVELLNSEHNSQVMAARMELSRAVEVSKQKERDHQIRVEELQSEISHRERHITNLKEDIDQLQTSIHQLQKEIEFKAKEVQKIKSDAKNQIRIKEEHFEKKMQHALDNMQADHIRESQELVNQFNQAQEILKDKISELQILLEEAEERYRNRDSRPEDLEAIAQLRDAINEREQRMKALIDEKKYYQMELVNRETNFNKVFNNSPNVGVINPLNVKKKKGDKGPAKFTSAPNLNKLDPLPNSPLHNEALNPSRPLPNPAFSKKFVR